MHWSRRQLLRRTRSHRRWVGRARLATQGKRPLRGGARLASLPLPCGAEHVEGALVEQSWDKVLSYLNPHPSPGRIQTGRPKYPTKRVDRIALYGDSDEPQLRTHPVRPGVSARASLDPWTEQSCPADWWGIGPPCSDSSWVD
jgi:hypothetical protein